jgi:hypothetical protein
LEDVLEGTDMGVTDRKELVLGLAACGEVHTYA